jgi:hypothetical protein
MIDTHNEMQQIIEDEAQRNGITIRSWSKSSCGCAYWNTKDIKIPKPVDFDTLGVGFHEMGHVLLGHLDKPNGKALIKKARYVEEYEAEQFSIVKLKEYGYYKKQYEMRAIAHVLMKIAQAKNRGHNMKNVPKEIVKWTGLQINKWNKAKKVYVSLRNYKKRGDIKIYLK